MVWQAEIVAFLSALFVGLLRSEFEHMIRRKQENRQIELLEKILASLNKKGYYDDF